MATVLVVEDDAQSRDSLITALKDLNRFDVLAAASGEEAIARLKLQTIDVIVSDVMMGRISGLDLLKHVQEHAPDTVVILMTAYGCIESAVEAMRRGAYDYVTKPIDLDHLEMLVERALARKHLLEENRDLREALQQRFTFSGLIGQSEVTQRILKQIEQVAPTNATVLILGESGTGKELVARAIHHHSRRGARRMVTVNCAALPESLIESELFGHERGAFTGANQMRRGRFELANGGTLFLDEVGDLGLSVQIKLLRALQEREIERVGGQTPIPVDVRLITATNRDLEGAITEGAFREELYYRLKVVTIELPPLRNRREDILPLVDHFLAEFSDEHGRAQCRISDAARRLLQTYPWPGNVRELRNVVESAVVTAPGDEIGVRDLPTAITPDSEPPGVTVPMGQPLSEVERLYTLRTLELLGGNKSRAAQVLGIGKKTLYRRLQEYGVDLDHDDNGASTHARH